MMGHGPCVMQTKRILRKYLPSRYTTQTCKRVRREIPATLTAHPENHTPTDKAGQQCETTEASTLRDGHARMRSGLWRTERSSRAEQKRSESGHRSRNYLSPSPCADATCILRRAGESSSASTNTAGAWRCNLRRRCNPLLLGRRFLEALFGGRCLHLLNGLLNANASGGRRSPLSTRRCHTWIGGTFACLELRSLPLESFQAPLLALQSLLDG